MDAVKQIDTRAMQRLKNHRRHLTPQQYRTIRGQILAGQPLAAMKGLEKILTGKGKTS